MVIPALLRGGYQCEQQVNIGTRLGGGRHFVDAVAKNSAGQEWLISLKWQQVSGTAEQKVPFEAICLADALGKAKGKYIGAYIVLGGPGWKLRDFYTGGGLREFLRHIDHVRILALESFIAVANQGQL